MSKTPNASLRVYVEHHDQWYKEVDVDVVNLPTKIGLKTIGLVPEELLLRDATREEWVQEAARAVERLRTEQNHKYGGAHPTPTGEVLNAIVDALRDRFMEGEK